MARVQVQPVLAQLGNASSFAEQNVALRTIKNETIGHIQKKERWVELGALDPIVAVLATSRSPVQPNGKDIRGSSTPARDLSAEEFARLQALELLGIFASGGPAFLASLQAAGALPAILLNLGAPDSHPRLILAALRTLVNLAEASSLALPPYSINLSTLADSVFTSQYVGVLHSILDTPSSSWVAQSQINMAASLISLLCREERSQIVLAKSGILDALATRLASYVVAQGQVVPGAEIIAQNEGLEESIPEPATPGLNVASILEAISAIIADSRLRACMLLYSPSILAIFPHISFDALSQDVRAAWGALSMGGPGSPHARSLGALDHLLPAVPSQQARTPSAQFAQFPPLGTSLSRESLSGMGQPLSRSGPPLSGWDASRFEPPSGSNADVEVEEAESPMIPWLISFMRSSSGMERLMAASVLTSLYKSGFASKSRETAMALLVVPPLIHLLDELEDGASQADTAWVDPDTAERWTVTERTLTVLARLITDSEVLQRAAFDCNAIKVVSKLLKDAYDPLAVRPNPRPWNPTPGESKSMERDDISPSCTLGLPGQPPLQAHRARLRESALKAIAAVTSFSEEYRKALVEQEVMPYIVESLTPTPSKPRNAKERVKSPKAPGTAGTGEPELDPLYGTNPVGVLIAACHAIRMLSRSVSILRTTLVDAGVAMPIFSLLRHPEIEVQVAATGVVCNLVTEVSPMREQYAEAGVMKILCEHAHSLNAPLRLNALWALKHFVDSLGVDMKKACLEELEPGWLVQLICDDTEDDALFARTKNEKQATVSPAGDMDDDVEMDASEEDGRSWPSSSLYRASFPRTSHERSRTGRLRQAETKISALHEAELNPVRKARSDDLAIQEQGLNFIRNLIGPGASGSSEDALRDTTEMIDYLFSELGQDRLFQILASKLKVKVLHPFSRRFSTGQSSRVLYPQAKIIEVVVIILVHISASEPRHRQLVIAQTELLKALLSHFSSKDKEVRVALCHLVANLTWRDDTNDILAASQRALELKRLGLLTKLEALEQEDTELDVRERAKSAIFQMNPQRFS